VIIISLAGIFFGAEAVQGKVYGQIAGLVGSDAAIQIQSIIKNIGLSDNGPAGAAIGIAILLVGATGVFTEIQTSLNYILSIKAKPKKGWLRILTNRLLSFSLIVSLGFIMLISLVVSALLDLLTDKLKLIFADYTIYLFHTMNFLIAFSVIAVLFTVIFKVLPDAWLRWRDAFVGACFSTVLFLIGKYVISIYITQSAIGQVYGTAASIIIILVWVYYSSIILYFGAEFTKVYAMYYGGGILPNETAVFIIKRESKEIELDKDWHNP
jgi:membrane protein